MAEPARRSDVWQELLVSNCVPFIAEPGSRNFEASIDVRPIGRFNCARIMQTSRFLARTRREIDRFDSNEIFVVLQLCGQSRLEQCGRTAELAPGGVAIFYSSLPSRVTLDGKNIHLVFHLPESLVLQRGPNWQRNVCTAFPKSTCALIASVMHSAFEHASAQAQARGEVVAEALAGLVAECGDDSESSSNNDLSARDELLKSVQMYILAHLGDGRLSPEQIAAAYRMSGRTLHRLFRQSGMSVCQWIRQSRLDHCAAELRDPTLRTQSISEIAFRWGFNDSAHFSNAFRAEFLQSPREYRSKAEHGRTSRTVWDGNRAEPLPAG
jgi:AraC family transcriptional activator of tynA and feaB